MIYDPITRQAVELLGRYPVQNYVYKFGRKQKAEGARFVKARYGDWIADWAKDRGGFPIGTERDVDLNSLVADEGANEIHKAYETLPELPT